MRFGDDVGSRTQVGEQVRTIGTCGRRASHNRAQIVGAAQADGHAADPGFTAVLCPVGVRVEIDESGQAGGWQFTE